MKRIEFISPVEAIRGNMSGKQSLRYADNDNPAYESPKGKVNYARNYRPSLIGAKVSKTGVKYFAVKTKTAVNMTPAAVHTMALAGGTGAVYAALTKGSLAVSAKQVFDLKRVSGAISARETMRKFYWTIISQMLEAKLMQVVVSETYAGSTKSVTLVNPWVSDAGNTGCNVSNEVLAKFWTELSVDGITFTIAGRLGIATDGLAWSDMLSSSTWNILGLTTETISEASYLKMQGQFVINSQNAYVDPDDLIVSGGVYGTTSEQPE